MNGGYCLENQCHCPDGFTGPRCETVSTSTKPPGGVVTQEKVTCKPECDNRRKGDHCMVIASVIYIAFYFLCYVQPEYLLHRYRNITTRSVTLKYYLKDELFTNNTSNMSATIGDVHVYNMLDIWIVPSLPS